MFEKETDQFLEDITQQHNEDPFAYLNDSEKGTEGGKESTEEGGVKAKNRRERRLEAKLQAERESSIQLAARLEALTEAKKFQQETEGDHLKALERLYGTETPEAREATEILKTVIKGASEEAKKQALEEFRAEQKRFQEEVKKNEGQLETMIEEIEDEYDVDLSSKAAESVRSGYFKLLERMSPKDSDGNIVQYADAHAVWEVYQSQLQKKTNPAKDIAARHMVSSGTPGAGESVDKSTERYLLQNGLI